MPKKQKDKIKIPTDLFQSMMETHLQWKELMDELEDYILTNDPEWLEKIKKAQQEHEQGNLMDFEETKDELGIE